MDISGAPLRAVRAALFTTVVVALSTASHVLLSGAPLPLSTVTVIGVAVFGLAYALAGRQRSFGRIAALLIPLELAADTVFTTGQHVCYGRMGGPVAGPLRSVGFDVLCGDGVGTPLTQVAGTAAHGGDRFAGVLAQADPATAWLLLGAHIGVGLSAAAWLHRGERALAQLLGAVTATASTVVRPLRLVVAAVTVRRAPKVRRPARPDHRTTTAVDRILVYFLGRRGPPCSTALA
ncbi:hypothetical protein [Streptomyces sp. KMM 9044]|uniref:hypothetical protein n=1 Tax=Streptomyces sp. KMM 9044 TaxID=2744474 RepID=UPI0021514294|nr:hypothetical protein [Streptomyces sp. KMM 9044]WAX80532.1 hypothetical protein HUV60_025565 [Streptomyces sp. KMM 9044]